MVREITQSAPAFVGDPAPAFVGDPAPAIVFFQHTTASA